MYLFLLAGWVVILFVFFGVRGNLFSYVFLMYMIPGFAL